MSGDAEVLSDITEPRGECRKSGLARMPGRISREVRIGTPLERGGHHVQAVRECRELAAELGMRLDQISRRGHRCEMGRSLPNTARRSSHSACHDRQAIVWDLVVHNGELHPRRHPQGGDHGAVHVIVNHGSVARVGITHASSGRHKNPDDLDGPAG